MVEKFAHCGHLGSESTVGGTIKLAANLSFLLDLDSESESHERPSNGTPRALSYSRALRLPSGQRPNWPSLHLSLHRVSGLLVATGA